VNPCRRAPGREDLARVELLRAKELGADSPLIFEVGPVEMQFIVAVTREGKANTGVRSGRRRPAVAAAARR
jgi:hypothetical protein